MNEFQSNADRAPVVVLDARARDRPVPTRESPFGFPEINQILLLKLFQSPEERYPFVEVFA